MDFEDFESNNRPVIQDVSDQVNQSVYLAQGRTRLLSPGELDTLAVDEIVNRIYNGTNLSVKFATEIAQADSVWAWLHSRIGDGDFSGILVGDYIPVKCSNNFEFDAVIIGINTYTAWGPTPGIPAHVDMMFSKTWDTSIKYNLAAFNNGMSPTESLTGDGTTKTFTLTKKFPKITGVTVGGNATTAYTYNTSTYKITFTTAPANEASIVVTCADREYPWLCSNLYYYLNSLAGNVPNGTGNDPSLEAVDYTADGIYYQLPAALQSAIVEKNVYLPKRYNSSAIQNDDTGAAAIDIGKLWLLSEMEICGTNIMGSNGSSVAGYIQYPYFVGCGIRNKHRLGISTATPASGNSNRISLITTQGYMSSSAASTATRVQPCFRIV